MIVYINDKWFDTEKLTEISHPSPYHTYYKTEKGTIIGASNLHYAGESPYYLIEEGTDLHKELQKYINPNPEDEL